MFLKESFIKTNFSFLLAAKDCSDLFGFTSLTSFEFSVPDVFIGVDVINETGFIDPESEEASDSALIDLHKQ